jgi:transposase InsO family protein
MVVMDPFTRRIIGFAVHAGHVNGMILCQMFNKVKVGKSLPRYLRSDNDPLFEYHRWGANLCFLEIDEIKTVPDVPVSHPFVERLIGNIRRNFLIIFSSGMRSIWRGNSASLGSIYNNERVHASLGGDTPAEVAGEPKTQCANIDDFRWQTHCRGLGQLPIAV